MTKGRLSWGDLLWPLVFGIVTYLIMGWWRQRGPDLIELRNSVAIGLPVLLTFLAVDRPMRHALALAAVLWVGWDFGQPRGEFVRGERTFFGVSRVIASADGRFHFLVHGNTLHGRQFLQSNRRCEPLAYYHRQGPVGDVFSWLDRIPGSTRVSVIGLGAGSMASYARAGEWWTFYEIDPGVIRIARDTNCFTYLANCAAGSISIIEGDARLGLKNAPDASQRLIVLDAFSSDAVPVHLLTREALQLYGLKLAPGGMLAFHISNRYMDLEGVLADLAIDQGWICRARIDEDAGTDEMSAGKETSHWVLMVRRKEDLGELDQLARWILPDPRTPPEPWTDDFVDVPSVWNWR